MKTGGCLCGAVTYQVNGALRPVVACHCVQCRKTSGHYVAATSAHRDDIEITGDVSWYHASDTARRGFCGTCGSSLFWDGPGENISIHAGTMDSAMDVKVAGHIFCADKGDYYDITDDLPQFAQDDAGMTTQVKP